MILNQYLLLRQHYEIPPPLSTHSVQGKPLQDLELLLGLQLVDALVRDEQASVGALVESIHLREERREKRGGKREEDEAP